MSELLNEYQQPVGAPMPGWSGRPRPQRQPLEGRYCRIEPLQWQHAEDLHAAYAQAEDGRDWTYMAAGPFADREVFSAHIRQAAASEDPLHFAVIDRATQRAVGTLALMRMDPSHGVIEVGHVMFSPVLKRTPISTEAQYLLMKHVFDGMGYRRYEWKCDSLNQASRKTARRLGFQFEGIFRQALVYKGRNRDTAWFSVIDGEWPALRAAFETWLAPANFDHAGAQRRSLVDIRASFPV